ncbi:hypothetical protein RchiOBHm_Chr7g0214251 [Rosa chinensis]|uniref:Uncharacterized protein n=1 Tax=Rosa chinensis TaxID=74649 RepID=A0A2P6PB86_ROSCH|nr:hypothetical protein RchiOBHm_Chr7g0214251 [Rosa chinensis]
MEDGIMHSTFTVICQSTTEQPKIDEYMVQNFEGALSTWGCSKHMNETKIMLPALRVAYIVDGLVILPFLYKLVFDLASQQTLR